MDPITIAQAVTGANHATQLMRSLRESLKASGKSDALDKVLDLQVALMDLMEKQQRLITDNAEMSGKVDELEKALKFNGELVRDGNALFFKIDTDRAEPYCMACWGHDHKLIGLIKEPRGRQTFIVCKICERR